MSTTHLMIVHPSYIGPLLSGAKTLESRLGEDRRAPFGKVSPGDTVFIKPTGKRVIAKAVVRRVDEFENLTPADVQHLRDTYDDRIMGGDHFWQSNANANFATLIGFEKIVLLKNESTVPEEFLGTSPNEWKTLGQTDEDRLAA